MKGRGAMTEQAELNVVDGHIELEKLPNVRDLGYLRTASGANIRAHRLIRSGALAEASDEDIRVLVDDYQVRTVIDLRTPDEQAGSPDPKDRMPEVSFYDVPILGSTTAGITRAGEQPDIADAPDAPEPPDAFSMMTHDPHQLMMELYGVMLLDDAGVKGYARFFEILLQSDDGAVLWHCSAGKDRAGLATVLLLHVLRVSRDAITADYLVTNRYLADRLDDIRKHMPEQFQDEAALKMLQVFNSADTAFLDAGISAVEQKYGSLDRYLSEALGLDENTRDTLCNRYLE